MDTKVKNKNKGLVGRNDWTVTYLDQEDTMEVYSVDSQGSDWLVYNPVSGDSYLRFKKTMTRS